MYVYVDGSMTFGDKLTHRMSRERYFCRELALSGFRRQTLGKIAFAADAHLSLTYLLILQRLPVQMEMSIYFNHYDRAAIPDALIDDIRALLSTHYPSVTFEMHAEPTYHQNGLREVELQGYTLRGNAQIAPAFFWSLFFFREYIQKDTNEYTTLIALFETPERTVDAQDEDDYDDDDDDEFLDSHIQAFDRLIAGTEPPAEYMLASGNGPIDTFDGREQQNLTASLARMQTTGAVRRYEEMVDDVIS